MIQLSAARQMVSNVFVFVFFGEKKDHEKASFVVLRSQENDAVIMRKQEAS